MKPLKAKADAIMEMHKHELANPDECSPIFSFDKCSVHTSESVQQQLEEIGIVEGQDTFPLPKYAGDIHKVIEHVHGTMVTNMQTVLWADRELRCMRFYRAQLRGLFEAYTVDAVQKDVSTLIDTCRIISRTRAEGGTDGDWAPRGYN